MEVRWGQDPGQDHDPESAEDIILRAHTTKKEFILLQVLKKGSSSSKFGGRLLEHTSDLSALARSSWSSYVSPGLAAILQKCIDEHAASLKKGKEKKDQEKKDSKKEKKDSKKKHESSDNDESVDDEKKGKDKDKINKQTASKGGNKKSGAKCLCQQ